MCLPDIANLYCYKFLVVLILVQKLISFVMTCQCIMAAVAGVCVRAVTNTELKLESQPSTLPRAGRSGKSLSFSATGAAASKNLSSQSLQHSDTASDPSIVSGKRRSAAHSYRMQTESSLAKVNSGKESSADSSSSKGSVGKKESYTMIRFPSTPDFVAEDREVDNCVELSSQRPGSVDATRESHRSHTDGNLKANHSGGTATTVEKQSDVGQPTNGSDRALMPPPLSTAVPLSYQATFIAKAAKHRRTTMPDSMSRSRELLAGAIAKHHRMSDSSATDGDDSPPSSLSAFRTTATLDHMQSLCPLEPPQRETRKPHSRASGSQWTDVPSTGVMDSNVEYSDSVSSADSSVSGSPRLIKITSVRSVSTVSHKRQLPPDPCVSTHSLAVPVSTFGSLTSSVVPQPSVTRSASAESGIRLVESTQDTALSQSASACHLSATPSAEMMSQRTLPAQGGARRPIASKTVTRLVLNCEQDGAEQRASTPQQTIISEIERFCAERRISSEATSQRDVAAGQQEPRDAASQPLVAPVGHTRQRWGKTKQSEPFIFESQSNSSVSVADSAALADVSSLSGNSADNVSSGVSGTCAAASPVIASYSDSVISYQSTVGPSAAVNSLPQIPDGECEMVKCEEDSKEQIGLPSCSDSVEHHQLVSAMSSDK